MEDDDEFGDLYTDVLLPFSSSLSSVPEEPQPAPPPRPAIDLALKSANFAAEPRVSGPEKAAGRSDVEDRDKELEFDIEDGSNGIADDSMPLIPGLGGGGGGGGGWGDVEEEAAEEDSESEDDLQIVLNDTRGPGVRGGGEEEEDDDDEDGEPLVIVGDGDAGQGMGEEQDWGMGEEGIGAGGAGGEGGERKEGAEKAGGPGGGAVGPKIGYSNHGYHHPFHSQFKYVRPGAAPLPGVTTAGPGGASGQVRPPLSMNLMAGRGRGDWRPVGIKNGPPMQKGFHTGYGMSSWGNNMGGRGFGGGLDFTLPSHKTIFDVDIDSFEEKPWKYPGVDVSDFFNFGLNEESWKDCCKLLEQHRLETTMQSKIRVYEVGRGEQDYDPDMPPELAAATGNHDVPADNSTLGKADVGQSDPAKGAVRVRQLPTGRAIQVETGYGERLPSIDTRPPRIRDSDAIIEIVCQGSQEDDSSNGNGAGDEENNDRHDDVRGRKVAEEDRVHAEAESTDDMPDAYNGRNGGRNSPRSDSGPDDIPEGDKTSLSPDAPIQHHTGHRVRPSARPSGDISPSHEERRIQSRMQDRTSRSSPSRNMRDKRAYDDIKENSVGNADDKPSPTLSSPSRGMDANVLRVDDKDDATRNELEVGEGSSGMEKDEANDQAIVGDFTKDGNRHRSSKKQRVTPDLEPQVLKDLDDDDDSKAARSSENSKGRSGSSRDHHKWQDGAEEEVIQDGRSVRAGSIKRHVEEHDQNYRRKDRDARYESERGRMTMRPREDPYLHRDIDPPVIHNLHMKNEGYDRRKELENPDLAWQRRHEDTIGRKSRNEDIRIKERGDDMGPRYKSKGREGERSDQDELLNSRKYSENGTYRGPYDKEGMSRHRDREDNLKTRYEVVDDYYNKRRKDEEYLRRDHIEKDETLHNHRDIASRRRREREDVLDPRKRDDQQRIRENVDDYHSLRHKGEVWVQRERSDRHRERDDLHRLKPSYDDNLLKQEREDGRGLARSVRGSDEKSLNVHARAKEDYKEYQLKDATRSSEPKKRVRMEDESSSHHRGRDDHARGSQSGNEEKKSRLDKSSARIGHAPDTSDNQRLNEKKHKQSVRKSKDPEGRDHAASGPPRKNKGDQNIGHPDQKVLKGTNDQGHSEIGIAVHPDHSKKPKEDASSDEEQQDSRRGRSKLERWTSHKERDFIINSKSSASLKLKESDKNNITISSEGGKLAVEPTTKAAVVEKHSSGEEKVADENQDTETKPLEDRHLDTVEKLKKRSERFKLPMPSEKDPPAVKKMESEVLPPVRTENPPETEIKPERPARKRRWISN